MDVAASNGARTRPCNDGRAASMILFERRESMTGHSCLRRERRLLPYKGR